MFRIYFLVLTVTLTVPALAGANSDFKIVVGSKKGPGTVSMDKDRNYVFDGAFFQKRRMLTQIANWASRDALFPETVGGLSVTSTVTPMVRGMHRDASGDFLVTTPVWAQPLNSIRKTDMAKVIHRAIERGNRLLIMHNKSVWPLFLDCKNCNEEQIKEAWLELTNNSKNLGLPDFDDTKTLLAAPLYHCMSSTADPATYPYPFYDQHNHRSILSVLDDYSLIAIPKAIWGELNECEKILVKEHADCISETGAEQSCKEWEEFLWAEGHDNKLEVQSVL